jgi:hypothetical protein
MQYMVYLYILCRLAASRFGMELNTNSAICLSYHTDIRDTVKNLKFRWLTNNCTICRPLGHVGESSLDDFSPHVTSNHHFYLLLQVE